MCGVSHIVQLPAAAQFNFFLIYPPKHVGHGHTGSHSMVVDIFWLETNILANVLGDSAQTSGDFGAVDPTQPGSTRDGRNRHVRCRF